MTVFRTLFLLSLCCLLTAASWNGDLKLVDADGWRSGQSVSLQLSCVHKRGETPEAFAGRRVRISLTPMRFNLFGAEPITVDAEGDGAGTYRFQLPAHLKTDYYFAAILVGSEDGKLSSIAYATGDKDRKRRFTTAAIAIRGNDTGPFIRLHTERARCVFSPGEEFRIFVSGRGPEAIDQDVFVGLYPQLKGAKPNATGEDSPENLAGSGRHPRN